MPKKQLEYRLEVEYRDGKHAIFSVYRQGKSIIIQNEHGREEIQHPSSATVADEIRIAFKAKVIRKIDLGETI